MICRQCQPNRPKHPTRFHYVSTGALTAVKICLFLKKYLFENECSPRETRKHPQQTRSAFRSIKSDNTRGRAPIDEDHRHLFMRPRRQHLRHRLHQVQNKRSGKRGRPLRDRQTGTGKCGRKLREERRERRADRPQLGPLRSVPVHSAIPQTENRGGHVSTTRAPISDTRFNLAAWSSPSGVSPSTGFA
jgi:hypothetical protein